MTPQKRIALALFASVGVNIFLLGFMSQETPTALEPKADAARPGPEQAKRKGAEAKGARGKRAQRKPPGSDALHMMRHMIQVMGGREDPRVKKIWTSSKGTMRTLRKELRASHDNVHETLTGETFDKEALQNALQELGEKSRAGQEFAQNQVVELAEMLTPEERKKLKEKAKAPAKKKRP